ncbi:hypothetical protein ACVWWP_006166 [Bradyrhizobium sp. LM3.6]
MPVTSSRLTAFEPNGKQRVDGDVERRPRPGQADDGDGHDNGSDQPADRHPGAADEDPEQVEQDGNRGHGMIRRSMIPLV